MKSLILLCLASTAFCATVGEFPFHDFNVSAVEETTQQEDTTTHDSDLTSEAFETEPSSPTTFQPTDAWSQEPSPLLQVIRDFLFQARDGLLDPQGDILRSVTEGSVDERTEKLVKVFEHGIMEATTILMSQVENAVVSTLPTVTDPTSVQANLMKRVGEVLPNESGPEKVGSSGKSKRQAARDSIVNISTSCSDCYNTLQSCVQKCFEVSNCNDIQRNVRSCPPPPSRLCNPFTPWNPVDECGSNEECKSPLLCCNDGCINKCVPGVWKP